MAYQDGKSSDKGVWF